ncbi:MAG: hypothetical protein JWM42_4176 [Burkholderia sp.]|nr:hypothetical protein [Burkholderia sp.]
MRCPNFISSCFGKNEPSGPTGSANNPGPAPRLATSTNVPPRIYAPNAGRRRGQELQAALRPTSSTSISAAAGQAQNAIPLSDLRAEPAPESAFVETKMAGTKSVPLHSTAESSNAGSAAFVPGDERLKTIEGRLAVGREVLQDVRRIYKNTAFKASNKLRARFDPASEEARAQKAYAETDKVFNKCMTPSIATAIASDAQGHNCYTLSLLAFDRLQKMGVQSCMVNSTAHGCVAMGPIPKGGALPADMRQWPKEIGICDPWCNIVCSAPEYRDRFEEKMAKWKIEGKMIKDDNGVVIAPDNPKWMADVLNGQKYLHMGDLWTKP